MSPPTLMEYTDTETHFLTERLRVDCRGRSPGARATARRRTSATSSGRSQMMEPRSELWIVGAGCRVQGAECRVQGAGCRVQASGCRVQGAGCRVQGAGCMVQGSGLRVLPRLGGLALWNQGRRHPEPETSTPNPEIGNPKSARRALLLSISNVM